MRRGGLQNPGPTSECATAQLCRDPSSSNIWEVSRAELELPRRGAPPGGADGDPHAPSRPAGAPHARGAAVTPPWWRGKRPLGTWGPGACGIAACGKGDAGSGHGAAVEGLPPGIPGIQSCWGGRAAPRHCCASIPLSGRIVPGLAATSRLPSASPAPEGCTVSAVAAGGAGIWEHRDPRAVNSAHAGALRPVAGWGGNKRERRDARPALGSGSRRCGVAPAPSGRGGSAAVNGPWESAESCIVRTSASVYRRLQESPRQPPRGMSTRGPPPPPAQPPSSPPAGGRFLKSESEDSGVEMASSEHSPRALLCSESHFSLDSFPAEEKPPGEEPPRTPRSRSASRRLLQAAQRSRRQRCPRQLSRRSASAADLAEPPRDPQEAEGAAGATRPPRDPRAMPEAAVSGQGLRYLEHVCQMLERLARLQQDNRALRQQAAGARCARPATLPSRQPPSQDLGTWRGEGFRPRSCSDSQAPAADPGPCRRLWGHSVSSPSLLDPAEGGPGVPAPDKDGRSHWGRVKVLLTRLTRRSLRGGRCR
ncbi:uncharacterized protein C8orf58 homolog isoform X2 [Pyrgilauda ruficollis]|uniref:uncharacterized protein C8orf58 homolog isoform X2 n=1 Tax=Pyrgilauda ruficollis TaxID=221976 RepID=UPI001B8613EC|nr:uncharacterized protein C8orf58 homolog isoform X2 [Pyrgilauda ruficollis]